MTPTLRRLTTLATGLLLTIAGAADALALKVTDLPVREINGKRYYYYKAQSKETLYSLSRKLGLTQEEIISFNPTVYDGVKADANLYFPVEAFMAPSKEGAAPTDTASTSASTISYEAVKAGAAKNDAVSVDGTVRHVVVRGETIYGISNRYGITTEQLMAANPATRSGLKAGMTLVIPTGSLTSAAASEATATVNPTTPANSATATKGEAAMPSGGAATAREASVSTTPVKDEVEARERELRQADALSIAVMLPFDAEADKRTRDADHYLEFYKGFLLAVDTLREFDVPIHITTLDAGNTEEAFAQALSTPKLKEAAVVIAPDERLHRLSRLAQWGEDNKVWVLNLFSVRDDSFRHNPYVIQGNVPHEVMIGKAVNGFIDRYRDRQIALVRPADAPKEKTTLQEALVAELTSRGIPFKEVVYAGSLATEQLRDGFEDAAEMVVVPVQMSQRDLNKLLSTVMEARTDRPADITIFGYPEWITYRGETKENLHKLGATYYSRFIDDPDDRYTKRVTDAYRQWYGQPMGSSVPHPGVMGFDTGIFLLRALKAGHGSLGADAPSYQGVQNGFKLTRTEGAGLYNEKIYFVNLRPTGTIDYQDL
ncbi:MAG: LysM peptidoglycan-binding domain-containing protein [Candidatus Amulumruptor caecigallinarius]|nr:LysM peptidoglycan-binding domain-containing protein [Candidatus Amulumruptor caecigallinarius]MCM1396740.1 LysM peptidoglycan-binding domain-containing protein [Candidatus Amulumruptor caecigallinarius]MCM1453202.1 LysM peptidoglycan-binding domain-containing protein [bacterium]